VLTAVACPSTSLCVAVDDQGNVVSSSDPGDVTPTWTVTNVAGTTLINGISCASTATFILGISAVLGLAAGPAVALPPPPSYWQPTLSIDGACTFTATATWSHARVDSVQLTVHVVGSVSSNQMTSTIKGRSAVGTLAGGAATAHTFAVTADFFRNGVLADEETSSSVDAASAFSL